MNQGDSSPKWCLKSRISSLVLKDLMSDITFLVGDPPQRFPCHKLILGIGSQVFQSMFYGDMPEKAEVFLPDISPTAFIIILQYLYSDETNITMTCDAFEVAYGAKKYLLMGLFTECEKYLLSNLKLNPENVCSIYEEADILEMMLLKEKCLVFIAKNLTAIFESGAFRFATKATLIEILKLDFLEVESETVVLEILISWGLKQCQTYGLSETKQNIKSYIWDLLKFVRILAITVPELEHFNQKYNFLDKSEELSILLNTALPQNCSHFKMSSPTFSSNSRRRTISDCDKIDIPSSYRFNDTNRSFCGVLLKQVVNIRVAKGQLTMLGVVLSLRPMLEYSEPHRKLAVDIHVKNSTGKVKSKASACLKPEKEHDEVTRGLFFDDVFVISEGEKVTLVITSEGEGIQLPQLTEEQVIVGIRGTDVELTVPKQKDSEKDFVIKKIMCVFH